MNPQRYSSIDEALASLPRAEQPAATPSINKRATRP